MRERNAVHAERARAREEVQAILRSLRADEGRRRESARQSAKLWREVRRVYGIKLSAYPRSAREWKEEDERRRTLLLRMLDTWWQAGKDFRLWEARHRDLWGLLGRALQDRKWFLDKPDEGPVRLSYVRPRLSSQLDHATWLAAEQFTRLLTSVVAQQDVGKCDRCGHYYLNVSGHRNKVYCSAACARPHTAAKATKERRAEEHNLRLHRVRKALWQFSAAKLHGVDWRAWLTQRTGVTGKWLTRALHRGEQGKPGGLVLSKRLQQCIAKAESEARLLRTTRR